MTGEISDDMIEGACCSLCLAFFEQENGYEVLCKECKADNPGDSRQESVYPVIKEMS
jgi:hypothetical protein